jgi:arsenite methyltransferase
MPSRCARLLIYEPDKAAAFAEFHRVPRPGGRLSLFEPINRFTFPEPADRFYGYDITPVADLVAKLKEVYDAIQPPGSDPMLDFDERDLVTLAEHTGFGEVHTQLTIDIRPPEPLPWHAMLNSSGNPRIPTRPRLCAKRSPPRRPTASPPTYDRWSNKAAASDEPP